MAEEQSATANGTTRPLMSGEQEAEATATSAAAQATAVSAVPSSKPTGKKPRATSRKTGPSAPADPPTAEELEWRVQQEAAARAILAGDAAELQRLIRPGVAAAYPQSQWAGQQRRTNNSDSCGASRVAAPSRRPLSG
jgi:hypothetical protein